MSHKIHKCKKWLSNEEIHHKMSNHSWNIPQTTDPQTTQLLKLRFVQYVGNHKKNLLWRHMHTNPNWTLCQIKDEDTWLHLLSLWTINFLRHKNRKTHWHCPPTHQPTKIKCIHTRHLTLIFASNQHGNYQNNTIPPWLLSCTCNTAQCECLAKLRPEIVYIQDATYEQNGPLILDLTIRIIKFTFTHNDQAVQTKEDKYNPLINAIRAQIVIP